nr:hypothetical protein [Candidatus Carsonella ruddii]
MKKYFLNNKFVQLLSKELEINNFNYYYLNIKKKYNYNETFYTKKNILRTHTSSIQNRFFKNFKSKKIKIFNIGKVYRKDNDKTHLPIFFQLDFFIIKKNIIIKKILYFLLKFISFFIKKKFIFKIRKVHFPFTIISIELDIYYNKNWLELLGFGLINNNIFINNKIYIKGIAGGVGVDRLFMICYKLKYIKEVYD